VMTDGPVSGNSRQFQSTGISNWYKKELCSVL